MLWRKKVCRTCLQVPSKSTAAFIPAHLYASTRLIGTIRFFFRGHLRFSNSSGASSKINSSPAKLFPVHLFLQLYRPVLFYAYFTSAYSTLYSHPTHSTGSTQVRFSTLFLSVHRHNYDN